MAQWLSQKISSMGPSGKSPLTVGLCLAFCALAGVFISGLDIVLMVVVLAFSIGHLGANSATARPNAKAKSGKNAKARQGAKAAELPAPGKEGSADGEEAQRKFDMRVLDRVHKEGVMPKASDVTTAMKACVRCNNADTALKLFDQMLDSWAVPDVHLLCRNTAGKFFNLVAESLDDERMREEGLKFFEVIHAHKVFPSTHAQNRLIVAWRSKPPDDVLAYFVKMKDAGARLSSTAYRCIMEANERTNPEFTLKLYDDMTKSGIKLDRVAYNAVLCACSQHGRLDYARELFMEMTSTGLVPNGKTFGIMLKVCYSSNRPKEAVAIFDTMREQRLEPDRFAYHFVIIACIKLERIEYAVELYEDMVRAKLPPCDNTYMYLSAACKRRGWTTTASRILKDLESVKQACAPRPPPMAPAAGASVASQ
jgi:pentatricopeptide repeat protein